MKTILLIKKPRAFIRKPNTWMIVLSGSLLSACTALAVVTVDINPSVTEHTVSKMALGSGMLYAWDTDALYANGEVAHMMKDIGLGSLRWPGGAVSSYYHWDDLNGNGWKDSWDPDYDLADDKPAEDFMDLDEYFDIIDKTGAEIMLGINMSSGKSWNREADGITEASNLVVYCQDQGYDVKYIFLDNEVYHPNNAYNESTNGSWSATSYADSFNDYAVAIKTTFPSAKLIANWQNNVTSTSFTNDITTLLGIAGANIDYVDLHYYWEWNDADWPLWKTQTPMTRTGSSQSYKDSVIHANGLFSSLGYSNIKTAVMEWNLGGASDVPWKTNSTHNNFKTALMQTEMQTQFLQAGIDIGLIFATHSPNVTPDEDKHVMQTSGDINSTALWIWLYSKIAGKTVVQSSSPATGIYIVTAKGDQGEMVTYLLKFRKSARVIGLRRRAGLLILKAYGMMPTKRWSRVSTGIQNKMFGMRLRTIFPQSSLPISWKRLWPQFASWKKIQSRLNQTLSPWNSVLSVVPFACRPIALMRSTS